MKPNKLSVFLTLSLLFPLSAFALSTTQTTSVVITQSLIHKIHQLKPNTSNSISIEKMIGPPAACLPVNLSFEAWVCQWKGNVASSGIINTLNIWFEAGMTTSIIAVDTSGHHLK